MKTKIKPCKSNYNSNEVKGCGKVGYKLVYGLCPSCLYKWGKSTERGKKWMNKMFIPKVSKKMEGFVNLQEAFTEKKSSKSLKASKENTKKVVHAYVRKRDKGKPCISCPSLWNDTFEAGHCHKAELYETLKYDLDNIHGQCVQCNRRKEGNLENYFVNLPGRIGEERFKALMNRALEDKKQSKVWDIFKLKEIRLKIKSLTKELS